MVGRQCDVCLAGTYAFPYCQNCECNTKGTTEDICDQTTAECFCKKNVIGPQCEFCQEGTFHLQEQNPDGCTDCFCFGKTTRCISSNFVRISIVQMSDWHLVAINTSMKLEVAPVNLTVQQVEDVTVGADFSSVDVKNTTVYFSAPNDYLGKKLSAYGGYLNYTVFYTVGSQGKGVET